tara:strand:- start:386 stop:931 length:546 start_codon:yes stop_codon:yes gene_type:complete
LDKHIFRKRKALTKDQCENIIKIFENINQPGVYTDQKRDESEGRGYICVAGDLSLEKYKDLDGALTNGLSEYRRKHPVVDKLYKWGPQHTFNIQKYNPGFSYANEHCEEIPFGPDFRILAWMFYLNNIKYKGGTCWPQQNFKSKPEIGDLYIWPAGWSYSHYGIAAPKEVKYIATGWGVLI